VPEESGREVVCPAQALVQLIDRVWPAADDLIFRVLVLVQVAMPVGLVPVT
jgi:hypothetical protein